MLHIHKRVIFDAFPRKISSEIIVTLSYWGGLEIDPFVKTNISSEKIQVSAA